MSEAAVASASSTRRPRLSFIDLSGTSRALLRGAVVVAVLVAVWYAAAIYARATGNASLTLKLPYPHDVLLDLFNKWSIYARASWETGSRAVIGFVIGTGVGLLLGIVMIQSRWIESAIVPYVLASQMIPLIALVPILRAILRDPDVVRFYICAYVTFFIVTIAVVRGLKNSAPVAVEMMGSLNASRWQTMRFLRFPAAVPYIFSGLRVAAPLSLIGALLVDFIGANSGLGYLLVASLTLGANAASTTLWSALVVTLVLGLVFTRFVAYLERRVSFWQPAYRAGATA
ncbi:MAG: ABC transporter permease subunit [Chloroflexota bacterium]